MTSALKGWNEVFIFTKNRFTELEMAINSVDILPMKDTQVNGYKSSLLYKYLRFS